MKRTQITVAYPDAFWSQDGRPWHVSMLRPGDKLGVIDPSLGGGREVTLVDYNPATGVLTVEEPDPDWIAATNREIETAMEREWDRCMRIWLGQEQPSVDETASAQRFTFGLKAPEGQ